MLHTPIKHHHHHHPSAVGHTHPHPPAQHAQSPQSRCSPHAVQAHAHELNFADWLHMSPAQVAMMSPMAAPCTPPNHHLFVPTPSPLQYAAVTNANGRNDFLATSPLSYPSPPFQVPSPYTHLDPYAPSCQYQQAQMHQVPTIAVSSENVEQEQRMQASLAPTAHTGNRSGLSPSPLSTEYFSYTGGHGQVLSPTSASPISHGASPFSFQVYTGSSGEGESTPVTTLSGVDESQANPSSQDNAVSQPLIDRLRGASPVTDAGSVAPGSPQRQANIQQKPVESVELPFRIAAPQPRTGSGPFSPMPPSSRPASALGALSELAELASRQPTPSQPLVHSSLASPAMQSHPSSRPASRPASALSTRSTASHARPHKVRRKQVPPHRFAPSLLRVQLPYQSLNAGDNGKAITASFIDGLARGPLEFEDDGHRYRTRSKLRSLKAEIQEREREADLMLIRRGLNGDEAGVNGEDKSGLDILASVSVTRRIELDSPKRSASPMSVHKAGRPKKGTKRAFRDLEDADCESVATASDCGSRTSSKRQRVPTEKAIQAVVKKEPVETRSLRSRVSVSARSSPVRTSSQKGKKPLAVARSAKGSPAAVAAAKNTVAVRPKDHGDTDNGESELSSLSSMSETEDAKSEDAEYSPKKPSSRAGPRSTKAASTSASTSSAKAVSNKNSVSCKANGKAKMTSMSIDIERGAAAIPMPVRKFPSGIPIHANFPLLYRRFPVPAYTDPNFLEFTPFGGSSPLSSVIGSPAANGNTSSSGTAGGGENAVLPPPSCGHFNAPRGAEDLYTPRFVKGVGRDKMGLCPICYESPERGGAGRAEWLSMKFSAFNYHMQYAHGISPITALPFSPPIEFRIISRTPNHKNEKNELLEGKCHCCLQWAPVEGVKCVEAKLKEIYWWKHAAQCHKGSAIVGEGDVHLEDDTAKRVRKVFEVIHARQHPTVPVLPKTCAGGPFISTPKV